MQKCVVPFVDFSVSVFDSNFSWTEITCWNNQKVILFKTKPKKALLAEAVRNMESEKQRAAFCTVRLFHIDGYVVLRAVTWRRASQLSGACTAMVNTPQKEQQVRMN